MPVIYVQDQIHEAALEELARRSDLLLGYGKQGQPIESVIDKIDGLLIRTSRLEAATIEAATRLKAIARLGVGYDNIDVDAATRHGIHVVITPQSNHMSVAEHVFSLLLALRRRTRQSDRLVREGRFTERNVDLLLDVHGSSLGILGLGRIGREVARIGHHGFGMEIIAYDPFLEANQVPDDVTEFVSDPAEVLTRSDAVTLHMPRTPETEGFIDRNALASMQGHAVLINTSRGGIIDEDALYEALTGGVIAGAGLDVFATEPPEPSHRLFELDEVVLSPHNAGLSHRAVRHMSLAAAHGLLDLIGGADPRSRGLEWEVVNLPSR